MYPRLASNLKEMQRGPRTLDPLVSVSSWVITGMYCYTLFLEGGGFETGFLSVASEPVLALTP